MLFFSHGYYFLSMQTHKHIIMTPGVIIMCPFFFFFLKNVHPFQVCVYVCMSFSHFISLFFGLCFNVRKNTFNDLHINTHTFIQHSGHHQLAKNWLYGFVNGSVVCVCMLHSFNDDDHHHHRRP